MKAIDNNGNLQNFSLDHRLLMQNFQKHFISDDEAFGSNDARNRVNKMRNNSARNKAVMAWHMSGLFRVYDNLTDILCFLGLACIILGNVNVTSSWGSEKNTELPVISLKAENLSLKKVFNQILDKTGYKVIFDFNKQLEDARFTFTWDNESLLEGLREIVKKSGVKNFAIVTDNENRTLKVFNFDRGSSIQALPLTNFDGTGLTLQELKALHEQQKQQLKKMQNNLDAIVIPPEGDHPGVTRRQLEALHARQRKKIALMANDPDTIAVPASDGHPALTNRQLQALHERQKNTIKKMQNNPDAEVIPPAGDLPGITRPQLQALHERQKREIQLIANDPDAIAVPASDGHPALTKRELQVLHEQQKKKLRGMSTNSSEVTEPPEGELSVEKKTSAVRP